MSSAAIEPSARFLRRQEVAARLGVSLFTITGMVKRGTLPPPVQFTHHDHRWPVEEIDAAMGKLVANRKTASVAG